VKKLDLKLEEYVRGVPEWALRETTTKYVEEVRHQLKRHIMLVMDNDDDRRNAIMVADDVLKSLEKEANDLLEEKIVEFMNRV
jgi:DNA polymerase III psi subunit